MSLSTASTKSSHSLSLVKDKQVTDSKHGTSALTQEKSVKKNLTQSTSRPIPSAISNSKSSLPTSSAVASSSSSASTSSYLSKLTPEQILKLKQKQSNPSSTKPISAPSTHRSEIDRATSRAAPSKPGVSAWDKIVADVKKKKPVNDNYNKHKKNESDEELDEYDDESEYDSEMDDFIADDDDVEEDLNEQNKKYTKEYSKHIREMFKYNPNKYKGLDDDIDDMETDYHTLMKEERNS